MAYGPLEPSNRLEYFLANGGGSGGSGGSVGGDYKTQEVRVEIQNDLAAYTGTPVIIAAIVQAANIPGTGIGIDPPIIIEQNLFYAPEVGSVSDDNTITSIVTMLDPDGDKDEGVLLYVPLAGSNNVEIWGGNIVAPGVVLCGDGEIGIIFRRGIS